MNGPPKILTTEMDQPSWFMEALGEVKQFAGRLVRNFFSAFVCAEVFCFLLAGAVYLGTRSSWRWVAIVGLFVVAEALALWTSVQIGIVLSLAQTVRAKGLARRVLDGLFAELLGITTENPQGNLEMTQSLHGISIEDLRTRLHAAANKILDHPVALAIPSFIRWPFRKAEQILVWVTVKVIVIFASAKSDKDQKVDLLELRANLTNVVDSLVTERITQGAIRLALLMALGLAAVAWGVVEGMERI